MKNRRETSLRKRAGISKENKQGYDYEKRAKELASRGFNEEAIGGMMGIREREARKLIKHETQDIILDGEL